MRTMDMTLRTLGRFTGFAGLALLMMGCPGEDPKPGDADGAIEAGPTDEGQAEVTPDVPVEDATPDPGPPDAMPDAGGDGGADSGPSGSYQVVQLDTGLPFEFVFKDLWASVAGQAMAVGNDGVVATYDGQAWNGVVTGGAELLNGVHAIGPGDVWAVGKDGVVMRSNTGGSPLAPFQAPGVQLPTLWGVSALAQNNVVAVGLGGTIARFDGTKWNQLSGPGQAGINWNAMAGGNGKVVMVGANGSIGVLGGAGLELPTSPTTVTLRDIHTADGLTYFAVGDSGTVLSGDGTNWTPLAGVPTFQGLYGVWAEASNSVYVVGNGGTFLHFNGVSWTTLDAKTALNLRAVYVSPSGSVTVTGDEGALVEGSLAGGFNYVVALDNGGELNGAWGTGESVFLVGNGAAAFHKNPTWDEEQTPITQNLRDVWGTAPNNVWAVGLIGKIMRWDGVTWEEFPSPTFEALETIWGTGPNDIFAAGSGGTLIHFDGVEWSLIASNTTENLKDVFALDASHIWAVGAQGTIMFFDGLGWNQQVITPKVDAEGNETPWLDELHGVWAAAPDDAWAVGANGQVAHWDGTEWIAQELNYTTTLRGIYGQSATNIWAVGNEGHILRYDGEEWSPVFSGSIATLYAVDGDGGNQMFMVGDIGTILSLEFVPDEQ